MNYQHNSKVGFPVDPLPPTRQMVGRLMLAASLAVDGPVMVQPEQIDLRLANCLLMKQARLLIAGTSSRRPFLLREAADVSTITNLDALVVRTADDGGRTEFDVKKIGIDPMFCGYRLWMQHPSDKPWLIPTAGEAVYIRMTPFGLELEERPPFRTDAERDVGFIYGSVYLSVATKGWF